MSDSPHRPALQPPLATVFRSIGGTPGENLEKVIALAGGAEGLVEEDAVVLIKPNVQWWNQGAPNLGALAVLVEGILDRPGGFSGEVLIAENCHRGPAPWTSLGWTTRFERNAEGAPGDSMGSLCRELKRRHKDRVSIRHWVDVAAGGRRVFHPREGEGYVYCDGTGGVPLLSCDNGLGDGKRRQAIMTYPILTTDRGTVVDFLKGIWRKGAYTGEPFRFFNLSALNHHSVYCGVTSSLKNYLGVADLSGGPDPSRGGKVCGDYANFHAFAFDKWSAGPRPGMLGRAVGTFMRTVRRADLNITTAEWTGLASRVDLPAARTRAVLASADPVALDHHAAKFVLYPNSRTALHRPDGPRSRLRPDLMECSGAMGGVIEEARVRLESFDHHGKRMQGGDERAVPGEIHLGPPSRSLLKHACFRLMP